MSLIFDGLDGSSRGKVVALPMDNNAPGLLEVEGWEGFEGFKSIFTRVSMGGATNHQFTHSLGERIHLSVFGDRIGTLWLSGLSFFETCEDRGKSIGISRVIDFFRKNKLSARSEPIRVTIDPYTVFEAYLHTMQCEAVSTAATASRMYQFHLTFSMPSSRVGILG